eukprot:m.160633 g.160633  ORF g.160633 m.160633 type:complete len:1284 (-) comp16506_c0_seq1:50-3901(-)
MVSYPTGPKEWQAQPLIQGPLKPFAYLFLVVAIVALVNNAIFLLYRKRFLPKRKDGEKQSLLVENDGDNDIATGHVSLLLAQGLKTTRWGTISLYLFHSITVLMTITYLTLVIGYYSNCQLHSVDSLCFFGDYRVFGSFNANADTFFVYWWLAVVWGITLYITQHQLQNLFRLPCGLREADFAYVTNQPSEGMQHALLQAIKDIKRTVKVALATGGWRKDSSVAGGGAEEPTEHYRVTVPLHSTATGTRYINVFGFRYTVTGPNTTELVEPLRAVSLDTLTPCSGLDSEQVLTQLAALGPNSIAIRSDSSLALLQREFGTAFFLYQTLLFMLWIWYSYLFVSISLYTVVIGVGILSAYIQRQAQQQVLSAIAQPEGAVVKRDGHWLRVPAREVVIGDLLWINPNTAMCCDAVLVQGSAVCDESSLTGESTPVRKVAFSSAGKSSYTVGSDAAHTLYSGTTVNQSGLDWNPSSTQSQLDQASLAYVVATGVHTSQGYQLTRMLRPLQLVFQYDRELRLAFACLLVYAMFAFTMSLVFQSLSGNKPYWVAEWALAVFVIAQTLSPLLPLSLKIGQFHSSTRLARRHIRTFNPDRVPIAGQMRVCCFDKTGTLTQDGLDYQGFDQRLSAGSWTQPLLIATDLSSESQLAMACCHSLTLYQGQLIGNHLERDMVLQSGWTMNESGHMISNDSHTKADVQRQFVFDHRRATMSVIVRSVSKSSTNQYAICKGASESILPLCQLSSAEAEAIATQAQTYAEQGYYVIAFGLRKLSTQQAKQLVGANDRDAVEAKNSFSFLGFLLFRNELRDDSARTLTELTTAGVRSMIITGDNAYCGLYIAYQAQLLAAGQPVYLGLMHARKVEWHEADWADGAVRMRPDTLTSEQVFDKFTTPAPIALAMSGEVYQRLQSVLSPASLARVLGHLRVCARAKPEVKSAIVEQLMKRSVVGMVGDGGNDAPALRMAHLGLTLSDRSAGITSPFVSSKKTVSGVVAILLEGRGALATNLSIYKHLIMFGVLYSFAKMTSYYLGVIMPQLSYLLIDLVAGPLLSYSLARALPTTHLQPLAPSPCLFSRAMVASLAGIMLIMLLTWVIALRLLYSDNNYIPWPNALVARQGLGGDWWTLGDNMEATTIFEAFFPQTVAASFIFSMGGLHRQAFYVNFTHTVVVIALYGFASILLLSSPNHLTDAFHIASRNFNTEATLSPVWREYQLDHPDDTRGGMSITTRGTHVAVVTAFLIVAWVWERFVFHSSDSTANVGPYGDPSEADDFYLPPEYQPEEETPETSV